MIHRATPNWRRTIATGGRPVEAVCAALAEVRGPAGIWPTIVRHDAGCPCLHGHSLPACDCELVELESRRVA